MERRDLATMRTFDIEDHLNEYVTKGTFSQIETLAPQLRRAAKGRGSPIGEKFYKMYLDLNRDEFSTEVANNW